MKSFIFAAAVLVSGAAIAQTTGSTGAGGTGGAGTSAGQTGTGTTGTSGTGTGTGGTGMGGTGMAGQAAGNYPPCSRPVTDSCIQTNERGMRRSSARRGR